MKRHSFVLGVLGLTLALLVGLVVQRIAADQPQSARVRLVHAVPGGPAVDVWVDGVLASGNVSYTTVTPYVPLATGPHAVEVTLHVFPATILSETVVLTGGLDLTVVGVGQGLDVTATLLIDNNYPVNKDTVRLVHTSPDTAGLDITVTGALTTATVSGLSYKGASPYIGGLGVGDATFEVRRSGEITTLLTFTRTLEANTISTVFIMGHSSLPGSLQFPLTGVHSVDQRFSSVLLPLVLKGGG